LTQHLTDTGVTREFAVSDEALATHVMQRDASRISWLVLHLALREVQSEHRFTLLGWIWPLVRQLAQLLVFVFLFSKVLKTGISNFPEYIFCGLLLWTWFSSGVTSATSSILSQRHLMFTARFPSAVLPLVAMTVPLVDTLMAMPILLFMIAISGNAHVTLLLIPVVLIVLYMLTAGVSLITAALNVYYRDVYNIVVVGLLISFYLTPIFYGLHNVPPRFQPILHVNPMTAIVTSMRAVALQGTLPGLRDVAIGTLTATVIFAFGWWFFARMSPDFVDEL
jgi:ABC-type polysaccharide/polyol phosphate export permease